MPRYRFAGITTLYRGRSYRSRLEARWAAFFDLLGWAHEYEPFDLAGWIPDFILAGVPGKCQDTLVEIKPGMDLSAFPRAKIEHANQPAQHRAPLAVLLLGHTLDHASLGWSGFAWGTANEEGEGMYLWRYAPALLCRHGKGWDFYNKQTDFRTCIHGIDEEDYPYIHASTHLLESAKALWNEAGNEVQWRKPPA